MKQIFLHFKSKVLFELTINNNQSAITKNTNDTLTYLINSIKSIYVKFNPISSTTSLVPYSFFLDITNNTILCENNNINIIPLSNNHYLIDINPISVSALTNFEFITKNLGKTYICINQTNPTLISIYNNNVIKTNHTLSSQSNNATIQEIKNCIVIKNTLINNKFEISIFDINNYNLIYSTTCESIENNDNTINCLIRKNENSNYAQIDSFDLTNQTLSTETIYLTKPKHFQTNDIIAYQFLLAIINKDFKTIKTLTSEEISQNLTNETINKLFTSFNQIIYDPFSLTQPTFILLGDNKNKKTISLNINDHKIIDFNLA